MMTTTAHPAAATDAHAPAPATTNHTPSAASGRTPGGLTLTALAERADLPRGVLVGLMIDHGMLELATWSGRSRRYFLTDRAIDAGLGSHKEPVGYRGGAQDRTSSPFPVIYPEKAADILWCLDYEGVQRHVYGIPDRRGRLAWLLQVHPSLPEAELAHLSGYDQRTIRRARAEKCPPQV